MYAKVERHLHVPAQTRTCGALLAISVGCEAGARTSNKKHNNAHRRKPSHDARCFRAVHAADEAVTRERGARAPAANNFRGPRTYTHFFGSAHITLKNIYFVLLHEKTAKHFDWAHRFFYNKLWPSAGDHVFCPENRTNNYYQSHSKQK